MRIEFVHYSRPNTVKYLRQTLNRIVSFCESLGSDADPEVMYANAAARYYMETPTMVMFAGVDDDDKVVAHLMATLDDYYGGKFVTIHQLWKNSDIDWHVEDDIEFMDILYKFGANNGAKDVRIFARNEEMAKLFESYGCFERSEKVILSAPIE